MTENSTDIAPRQPQQHDQTTQVEQQKSKNEAEPKIKQNCDILLHNFLVGKRRFRVLLHYDHIVWEHLDGKPGQPESQSKNQKECVVEAEQLSHRSAYGKSSKVVHIDDVITVKKSVARTTTRQETLSSTAQYLNIHYAVRIIKSATDCNRWRVRSISFYNADATIVQQWYSTFVQMLRCQQRVQRLLVFINPYGGRKQGLQTYEHYCKPLFQLAGIDASCIISQRANQIRDIIMSHDLTAYDAVCCVGGDGTVAEVINGLLFRSIRDHGMDTNRPAYVPKPTLPMGIIPAGSTDTVAYSLHGTADVRTAAIHLILGQRRGLDICSVRNSAGILRFCASVFSYGYLGDVAAKSAKYRWMGTKRYEYTGVKAFLMNRGYEAEIHMLLPNAEETSCPSQNISSNIANAPSETLCYANCQRCSAAETFNNRLEENQQAVANRSDTAKNETVVDSKLQAQNASSNILTQTNNVEINLSSIYNEQSADKPDEVDKFKYSNNESCDKTCVIDEKFKRKHCKTMQALSNEQQHQQQTIQESNKAQPCDIVHRNNDLNEAPNNDQQTDSSASTMHKETITENNTQNAASNSLINNVDDNNQVEEPNMKWKVVKGSFFMISGANITCACSRSPNGISRYSHLGDGHLDLILVRKTSLMNNVRFVINTMGRDGDIRNLPFVEVYRTRKFFFRSLQPSSIEEGYSIKGSCQPITATHGESEDEERISSWNCDGEVVKDLNVTMSSHCQLIDVFMRGPYPYVKNSKNVKKTSLCCCCSK